MGPRLLAYVEKVWEDQHFVLQQAQFYSDPVSINRGVTQGDIDSPIIFNIIMDAVLREWSNMQERQEHRSDSRFYADDGLVENTNKEQL